MVTQTDGADCAIYLQKDFKPDKMKFGNLPKVTPTPKFSRYFGSLGSQEERMVLGLKFWQPMIGSNLSRFSRTMLILWAASFSCTHGDDAPHLDIVLPEQESKYPESPKEQLAALLPWMARSEEVTSSLADVHLMLLAKVSEKDGDMNSAKTQWLDAFKLARGRLLEHFLALPKFTPLTWQKT
jgi:hypothetical protein